MKVILLKDVPKLGKKDAVKDVPQGHALNFLIPRKLAIVATPGALAQLEKKQAEQAAHHHIQDSLLKETFAQLRDVVIVLNERANEQGHLFSKITAEHVLMGIKRDHNVLIDASWVMFAEPIKATGDHVVTLSHKGVKTTVTVRVVAA